MTVDATAQTPASSAHPAYDHGYDDRGHGWRCFAGWARRTDASACSPANGSDGMRHGIRGGIV